MNRLLVLLSLTFLIGIVAAYPSANKRLFGLGRSSAGLLKAKRAFDATKKNIGRLDELKKLVETLKRNYDGQEQTGDLHEQQTRHQQAPSDGDQQHHSNQQQEQHHQQETNWRAYFYHVVYEIESGSLPSVYYNEIIIQQELLLWFMMDLANDCNIMASDCETEEECDNLKSFPKVEDEVKEIKEMAEQSYNYINPDWNEIVKEFNALEVYYGELEQRAMQNSDGWLPVCWFTMQAMDKEMAAMHRAMYELKGYEHHFTFVDPPTR